MIGKYYGKSFDLNFLRQKCSITKIGVSMLGISEAAEAIGFRTLGVKVTAAKLTKAMDAGPCIIHWQQNHFVVLYKIRSSLFSKTQEYCIADPAKGLLKLSSADFIQKWKGTS